MQREPYPSDVTDEQWAILGPLIPPARPGGRPRKVAIREVINAILYRNREGCTWRALPHDFPAWKTVYNYFEWWSQDGTWKEIHDTLRRQVRRQAGRAPGPSAACLDSQTVKGTEVGGERGYDGGKKLRGRKRHFLTDTLGLLVVAVVSGAGVDDAAAAPRVLEQLDREEFARLRTVWADSKYHNHQLYAWVEDRGWYQLVIVSRPPGSCGFVVVVKRWVAERTFAWLGRYRIHSRDYERLTESSESQIYLSMTHRMLQRLTRVKPQYRFRYRRRNQAT